MPGNSLRATIRLDALETLLRSSGARYVTPRRLARALGISTRTAGRILAALERAGSLERHSRRAYRLVEPGRSDRGH